MDNIPLNYDQLLASEFSTAYGLGVLAVYLLIAVALWKVFSKAGYPGILALIPIVNVILLVKIAGYSAWLSLLYLIPIVNIIFAILVAIRLGERFGKGAFFSVIFLWLFAIIGYFVIGFGRATYSRR